MSYALLFQVINNMFWFADKMQMLVIPCLRRRERHWSQTTLRTGSRTRIQNLPSNMPRKTLPWKTG